MLDKKTKIGILSPISFSLPPKSYAPYERDVDLEIKGLLKAGYKNLTLFATKQARYKGVKTVYVLDKPFREHPTKDPHAWDLLHIANALEYTKSHGLDILHNHLNFYPLVMNRLSKVLMVTTIHSTGLEPNEGVIFAHYPKMPYIAVSNVNKGNQPDLNYVGTVYNGVDFDQFSLGENPGNYLVYAGRMRAEKGVHHAIELAKRTNTPLRLAGFIQSEWQSYFDDVVKPEVDGKFIQYVGNLPPKKVHKLVSQAKAYVALNEWNEPFGNSIAEAMACGTPIIATPKGSHKELIKDGVTGIFVKDVDEAVCCFTDIDKIDRRKCRQTVEKLYSIPVMTQQLLQAFEKTLHSSV